MGEGGRPRGAGTAPHNILPNSLFVDFSGDHNGRTLKKNLPNFDYGLHSIKILKTLDIDTK